MNTRHDFLTCCAKLSTTQLDTLISCINEVKYKRQYPHSLALTDTEKRVATGARLQAIKLYRNRTYASLTEAAMAVDAYIRTAEIDLPQLTEEEKQTALNRRAFAIRDYWHRNRPNIDLNNAAKAVDHYLSTRD